MNLIEDEVKIFLTTPVGLEKLLEKELDFLELKLNSKELVKGGIEIQTYLKDFSLVLPFLKVPTKALLRIENFKCRDLPKLFNKTKNLNWNKLLLGHTPNINVTAKSSRLIHTKKIETTFLSAIDDYYKKNEIKKKFKELAIKSPIPSLHIRIVDDNCQISLELNGERLDKRGIKKFSSEAPIRENLASSLISFITEFKGSESFTLLDPMCGSGTLLFEYVTNSLPQIRDFYIDYLLPLSRKKIKDISAPKAIGIELNSKSFNGLKENLIAYNNSYKFEFNIQLIQGDCFKTKLKETSDIVLISNAPYGERVKIKGDFNSYFNELLDKFINNFGPTHIGLLLPKHAKTPKHQRAHQRGELSFSNGGIDVKFIVWEIQRP